MNELIIFYDLNVPSFFIPLAMEIKKVAPFISVKVIGKPIHDKYASYFNILKNIGVEFLTDDEFVPKKNHVILVDGGAISGRGKNKLQMFYGHCAIIVRYRHASDIYDMWPNSYYICIDRQQMSVILSRYGIQYRGEEMVYIPSLNSEIFLGGYYHYFEMLPYLKMNKSKLRNIMENKLNIKLNPMLPVISYTTGEYVRENKFVATLKQLSQHYNVVIKELYFCKAHKIEGENIFICRTEREPVIRFASDINLVPVSSGSLKSCFAFGLRSIPVFSSKMGGFFSRDLPELQFIKDRTCTSLVSYLRHSPFQLEYYKLVPPVSFDNYNKLRWLIENKGFWISFDKKIKSIREKIFGDLSIEDSVNRSVSYLLNLLLQEPNKLIFFNFDNNVL